MHFFRLLYKMNQFINKRVTIGQKIAKYAQEELLQGLYIHQDYVYASIVGVLSKNQRGGFYVQNKFPVQCFDVQIGDIVYGQVTRIREDEAFVNLIQINQISLSKPIQGTIRKEHVRQKMIDQVVMIDSFRPNDIIKAKVLSLGDSSRNLYLTTAAEDLGVLLAKNEQSNQLMLPYDWSSMIDVKNGLQEKRKVAKPEL